MGGTTFYDLATENVFHSWTRCESASPPTKSFHSISTVKVGSLSLYISDSVCSRHWMVTYGYCTSIGRLLGDILAIWLYIYVYSHYIIYIYVYILYVSICIYIYIYIISLCICILIHTHYIEVYHSCAWFLWFLWNLAILYQRIRLLSSQNPPEALEYPILDQAGRCFITGTESGNPCTIWEPPYPE